jgi:hypothetical protein
MWEFFSERVALEPWEEGETVPVEVELEAAERPVRARGPGEGAWGNREVPPEEEPTAADRDDPAAASR